MSSDNGTSDALDESETIEDDDRVTLVNEDGEEMDCVILAIDEFKSKQYALLAPAAQVDSDDEDEALQLMIFEYDLSEDGVETFGSIDDESTWDEVQMFFASLIETEEE